MESSLVPLEQIGQERLNVKAHAIDIDARLPGRLWAEYIRHPASMGSSDISSRGNLADQSNGCLTGNSFLPWDVSQAGEPYRIESAADNWALNWFFSVQCLCEQSENWSKTFCNPWFALIEWNVWDVLGFRWIVAPGNKLWWLALTFLWLLLKW